MGVKATENHANLVDIPMVILCVGPVHLRQLIDQMQGVLKDETLLVSIMAGVTVERIRKLLKHELVVRTMVDVSMLPVQWSPRIQQRAAIDDAVLDFRIANDADYMVHAARHLVGSQEHMESIVQMLKAFGKAQGIRRMEVQAILDEVLFGILPTATSSTHTAASFSDCDKACDIRTAYGSESSVTSGVSSSSSIPPYRRRGKPRKNRVTQKQISSSQGSASTLSRTFSDCGKFDRLDDVIEVLVWPNAKQAFVSCKEGNSALIIAPSPAATQVPVAATGPLDEQDSPVGAGSSAAPVLKREFVQPNTVRWDNDTL